MSIQITKLTQKEKEFVKLLRKNHYSWAEVKVFIMDERKKVREEIRRAREKEIVEMRIDQEMSLDAISKELGITRERVRQILKIVEVREGTKFPERVSGKALVTYVAARCQVCKTIVEVNRSAYDQDKGYNCPEHKGTTKKNLRLVLINPGWLKMNPSDRRKWQYNNDPQFRATHNAAVKSWTDRNKNTPEFKERVRVYTIKWRNAKLKSDPDYFKRLEEQKKAKKTARLAELRERLSVIHNGG